MTTTGYHLSPWTTIAAPHDDVRSGALDMGTYAANLARVYRRAPHERDVYLRADRFFAATYLTDGLMRLLVDVLGVLAGNPGDRVLQLRTPFGGGKTHTLLALLHLAQDRAAAIGASPELVDIPDPGPVRLAVLSGEELDPLTSRETNGCTTRTLWGELGAQLGRYDLVADHDTTGSAPGEALIDALLEGGPVLVLLDEVMVYVEKAMAVPRGDSTLGRQAMLFVQALTERVNGMANAAMVYSLQASVGEAVGSEGLLTQLDHLVSRIDAKREPVTGDEVMRVVQRRLFADLGDPGVHRTVAGAYADLHRRQLEAQAETAEARRESRTEAQRLEERVLSSYPFHPALLDLMYHRWGTLPSYQRTRGALQFLASVVHALWERDGDRSALIGPGEVDFSDEKVRGAFFSQVGERERFTSVLDGDLVAAGSGAVTVDARIGADSPALAQLHVGSRVSGAIMLYSFGTPEGEERGVLEGDLVSATLVPGLDRNVILAALHDLRDEELFLHYTGRRYRFEPVANLTKLVRDEALKFTAAEVLDTVRKALEDQLAGADHVRLWPKGPEEVDDRKPWFTWVYLGPDWSEGVQPLASFVDQARGGKREYKNALGFVLPDPATFDRARASARLTLAARSLLDKRARYDLKPEQVAELQEKERSADRDLRAAVEHGYSRVALPMRAQGDRPWELEESDLRTLLTAGRRLHERVTEAVAHRVFTTVTSAKLVSLAGLGPDRQWIVTSELVAAFFSYFDFTKLTSTAAIVTAISTGVADRKFAYVPGFAAEGPRCGPPTPAPSSLARFFRLVTWTSPNRRRWSCPSSSASSSHGTTPPLARGLLPRVVVPRLSAGRSNRTATKQPFHRGRRGLR